MEAILVKKVLYEYSGRKIYCCPKCGKFIERIDNRAPWDEVKYCKYCGQAVKWE